MTINKILPGAHRAVDQKIMVQHHSFVYLYVQAALIGQSDAVKDHKISFISSDISTKLFSFIESLGYAMFHEQGSTNLEKCDDENEDGAVDIFSEAHQGTTKFFKAPNSYCFAYLLKKPRADKRNSLSEDAYQVIINIAGSSPDIQEDIDKLISFAKENNKMASTLGEIYTIASYSDGYYFSKMGKEGEEYIASNYSPEHAEVRDYIIEQLNAVNPQGRLSIFFGPPGTGKTHFIKSLLGQVKSSLFVYVPPHLVPQISNPTFISAVIEQRKEHPNKKIIFVLEDADQVLATRMSDNISDINGLLNLTDGFLASSFDIRIIATTNSKIQDIDSAIVRPGRLCAKLNFGPLTKEQAVECFYNLTSGRDLAEVAEVRPYTLAEIYALVAEGKKPSGLQNKETKKSFGF